jgi:hypothetical protein
VHLPCAVLGSRPGVAAADDDDVLVLAVMKAWSGTRSPSLRRFCSGRYSIAKWMPASSRPFAHWSPRSRRWQHQRFETVAQFLHRHVDADAGAGADITPSSS